MKKLFLLLVTICIANFAFSKNPIIPGKGINDPHIRIINGKAYLATTRDKSIKNEKFVMEDWQLWSSDDLVSWKLEYVLKPEETYIDKPFPSCWATDFAYRNGKYYWYFSEGNQQTGVMVADKPSGPWTDPLGKPLLGSDLTPTQEYDPGIVMDQNGDYYIVFGVWDFYIAKLNEDMISLAEEPRKIEINNPRGPYNQDGLNTKSPTDDKPFIHFRDNKFYLSWGCFYAMSDNVYGPYDYVDAIMNESGFAEGYIEPTWPHGYKQGRHGSFFEWHNQWYFSYCDISQTNNRFFRDSFLSYIHYKENGEIAPVRVDGMGVGEYDASQGRIEAEDYFKSSGTTKKEYEGNNFKLTDIGNQDYLIYNKVKGISGKNLLELIVNQNQKSRVEIRNSSPDGELLTAVNLDGNSDMKNVQVVFNADRDCLDLCFVFLGEGEDMLDFDGFKIREYE